MKYFAFLLIFFSQLSFACWKLEGIIENAKGNLVINQRVDHDKTYSLAWSNLLIHFKLPNTKGDPRFEYEILERTSQELKSVAKASFPLSMDKEVNNKLCELPYIKSKLKLTKI